MRIILSLIELRNAVPLFVVLCCVSCWLPNATAQQAPGQSDAAQRPNRVYPTPPVVTPPPNSQPTPTPDDHRGHHGHRGGLGHYGNFYPGYPYPPFGYGYSTQNNFYGSPYFSSQGINYTYPWGYNAPQFVSPPQFGFAQPQFGVQPFAVPPPIVNVPLPAAAPVGPMPAIPHAIDVQANRGNDEAAEIQRRVDVLKASTPAHRERADRVIALGDEQFADQRYTAAAAKYREAISRAPDYPRSHFRLAHSNVATTDFNLALTRFLMAIELAGAADRGNFSLSEMYRGDKLAKQRHFDQLQDAMLREPTDGGLVFLLAISLHYDQQPLVARELFVKAQAMPGPHQHYVHHFLPVVEIADAK